MSQNWDQASNSTLGGPVRLSFVAPGCQNRLGTLDLLSTRLIRQLRILSQTSGSVFFFILTS